MHNASLTILYDAAFKEICLSSRFSILNDSAFILWMYGIIKTEENISISQKSMRRQVTSFMDTHKRYLNVVATQGKKGKKK